MSAHVCAIVRACVRVRLPTGGRVSFTCNIKRCIRPCTRNSMRTQARTDSHHVPPECSACQRLSVPDGHAAERKRPTGMRPLRCHTREMAFVVLQQQRRISRMPTDEAEAKEVSTCISDALTCRAPMQFYPTVLYSPGRGIVLPRVHRSNGPIKWRMRMCCLGKHTCVGMAEAAHLWGTGGEPPSLL
jgi:hypothetical protein